MDEKRQTAKPILEYLRAELSAHNISHEQIALASVQQGNNAGNGYKLQKIKDVLTGRSPMHLDLVETMVEMVESAMKEKERVMAGDLTPYTNRLKKAATRRQQLESETIAA